MAQSKTFENKGKIGTCIRGRRQSRYKVKFNFAFKVHSRTFNEICTKRRLIRIAQELNNSKKIIVQ